MEGTFNSQVTKYVNTFQYDAATGLVNSFKYGDNAVDAAYLKKLWSSADLSIICNYRTYDADQGGFSLTPKNFSLPLELDIRVEFHLLFI